MSAIEFADVSFGYGGADAAPLLEGFSLEIAEGGVTCIVGPNGCGKSTTLKLACGLLEPSAGSVRVQGRDLRGLASKERARVVSLLAQQPAAAPMTVRQLVECGRFPHHGAFPKLTADDAELVLSALETCGAAPFAERMLAELSGGQLQRAYLAMVLAQDAPVILLDEPTAALDASASFEIAELMRTLASDHGKAVVAVIHDINLALSYADELCVMSNGRLLAQGSAEDERVLDAVERAFDVRVELLCGKAGSAYGLFRRR